MKVIDVFCGDKCLRWLLQTMLKNRAPYDAEVDAEVAKEYQRIQDEKRRVRPNHGSEIEAMRTRVTDLEGSVTRLGADLAASHKRMEDMMRTFFQNHGPKQATAIDVVTEPSSSTKMLDTSALTSTTEELTMLAPKQTPTAVLSAMGGGNSRLASVVRVPDDVVEDVATDALTDVQGVQTSSETIIASIIEDILEEGKKPTETPAIDAHVEPMNEEVPVQAMEDVEEGHPEISCNADVPEEIVSLEQVTLSKTHEYIPDTLPSLENKFSFMFTVGMLFLVSSALSTWTYWWTSDLTDCSDCRTQQTAHGNPHY